MTTPKNRNLKMMRNLPITAILTVLSVFTPAAASAATQGPDSFGYSATDATTYNFFNLAAASGVSGVLAGADDSAAALSLPFSFNFYGTAYTNICVTDNGAVYFVTDPSACNTITDFQNQDLSAGAGPGDLPALFPYWADMRFAAEGSAVYYQTVGTPGNRRFILQWQAASQTDDSTVTFQAVLAEGTNSVTFQYATVNVGAAPNGAGATVAIRNTGAPANGQQIQWSYSAAALQDSYAIVFQTSAAPGPPALISPASGATNVTTPVILSWNTTAGAINYDVFLSTVNPPTTSVATNQTGTTFTTAALPVGATYYWRVAAKNGSGSTNSAVSSFSTPAPAGGGGGGGGAGGGGGGGGVAAGNPLTVTPETVTLTASASGGKSTQTISMQFQTYTQGAPSFSINSTTNQGFGWLSVSPASGTMTLASYAGFLYTYTATATISVDPAGIAAGASYTGSVNVSAGGGVAAVGVTMNVVAQTITLTPSPRTLSFSHRKGETQAPAAQTVSVTSTPSGAAFSTSVSTTSGGNWLSVAPTSGSTPGTLSVSVNAGVLNNLATGTYSGKVTISGNGATSSEVPVTVSVVRPDAPLVPTGGIVPVYSNTSVIQSGSWVSIYGSNLASQVEVWQGDFPTTLGGVSVTINGKPAYLWFVSPTQINLQAPDDAGTGTVAVVINTPTGSVSSTVTLAPASPSFSLLDATRVAALTPNPDGSYDIVGPVGAFSYPTRPVAPGDSLILYGVGFGPTDPAVRAGQPLSAPAATVNPVTVTIGGVPATVAYSGMVAAGLYQINVTVPAGVPSGDQSLRATVSGTQTRVGPVVTIR